MKLGKSVYQRPGLCILSKYANFLGESVLPSSPLTQPDPLVLKIADPASARQLAGKGVKGTVE
jgi:hypothetical protein